jgi:hypothetical protein
MAKRRHGRTPSDQCRYVRADAVIDAENHSSSITILSLLSPRRYSQRVRLLIAF